MCTMNDPLKYSPFDKNIKHLEELKSKNNNKEVNIFSNTTKEYNDSIFDITKTKKNTSKSTPKSSRTAFA